MKSFFCNSFPFNDSKLGLSYDDKVLDKVGDFSISIEKESIKNQGRWNFEVSEPASISICDPDESTISDFLPEPSVRRSNTISKLPTHLNVYEVSLNYTSIKYPIESVCSVNSKLYANVICLTSNLEKGV